MVCLMVYSVIHILNEHGVEGTRTPIYGHKSLLSQKGNLAPISVAYCSVLSHPPNFLFVHTVAVEILVAHGTEIFSKKVFAIL